MSDDNEVLAVWAPAGSGRIVVVLGQGVVIHKWIVAWMALLSRGGGDYGNAFIEKVLRNGVDGLLASPRKTLVPWNQIISAEYRKLAMGRARMIIRTADQEYTLKFLQNSSVEGDPVAVFAQYLGARFTADPASGRRHRKPRA